MLSDTEFKGEGPAPSGSGPPLGRRERVRERRRERKKENGVPELKPF